MPAENFGASGKRCRWATSSSGVRRVAWTRRSRSGIGQASLLAEWVVALRYLQEERPLTLPKPSTGRDHTERFPPPHTRLPTDPPSARKETRPRRLPGHTSHSLGVPSGRGGDAPSRDRRELRPGEPLRYGLTAELMDACANLQFVQLMHPEHWRAGCEFFRGGPVLCDAPPGGPGEHRPLLPRAKTALSCTFLAGCPSRLVTWYTIRVTISRGRLCRPYGIPPLRSGPRLPWCVQGVVEVKGQYPRVGLCHADVG